MPEPIDDFERELQQAFERRPAPPSLKRKIMERRRFQRADRLHHRAVFWQRLAASVLLAGALGNHALNEMNAQLAARNRNTQ